MPIFYLLFAAFGLADATWWRWADNRAKRFRHGRLWRWLVAIFVGSQLLYLAYFIVAPRSSRKVHAWMPMAFIATTYIWHLLVLPASLLVIGIEKSAVDLKRRLTPKRSDDSELPTSGSTLTRRQMLTAVALAAPPIVTMAAVGRAMPQLDEFRIRTVNLRVAGLPPNLDGLRIAHVSDVHIGRYTRSGMLPKIIEATNQLRADLVMFTGDLIDLSLAELDRGIDMMKQFDPRHGLAMIQGNHDLIEDPAEFDRRTKAAGLPLLVDETMTFSLRGERVQILGMRWGMADRTRHGIGDQMYIEAMDRLQPQREPGAFPILLAHHPHAFDTAAAVGLPLTLSGHTHGGLLMLNRQIGFGPLFFRYWSGVYQKGSSQMVVNNGVGNWFPLRVNAPAEIIDLRLSSM
jgi:uncharacterized protein